MKSFLAGILFFGFAITVYGRPAQVIIIRHGEKPKDSSALHLSAMGERRAQELVNVLTTDPELTRSGLPTALFAAHPTKRGHGMRTEETIEPLAKRLGLPIQTPFQSSEFKTLAKSILTDERFRGKTVLVCWTHEHIPDLAAALGVRPRPEAWDEQDYDRVYLISYTGKTATLKELSENLTNKLQRQEHKRKHALRPE